MLKYKSIEIFTSEQSRCAINNRPLLVELTNYFLKLKIPARCIVTRGIAGFYENGEIANRRMEVLSFNMPIRIYIVLPESDSKRVLKALDAMVGEGMIALHDLSIATHRCVSRINEDRSRIAK